VDRRVRIASQLDGETEDGVAVDVEVDSAGRTYLVEPD
jgi:hypothetical protein